MKAYIVFRTDYEVFSKNVAVCLTEDLAIKYIEDISIRRINQTKKKSIENRYSKFKLTMEKQPTKPKEISEMQRIISNLGSQAHKDSDYKELFEKKRAELTPKIQKLEEDFSAVLRQWNQSHQNSKKQFMESLSPDEIEIYTNNWDTEDGYYEYEEIDLIS